MLKKLQQHNSLSALKIIATSSYVHNLQKVLECMFSFYNELPVSIHRCAENATKCVAMHHLFVPLCSTYISYRTSKLDRLVAM